MNQFFVRFHFQKSLSSMGVADESSNDALVIVDDAHSLFPSGECTTDGTRHPGQSSNLGWILSGLHAKCYCWHNAHIQRQVESRT